jgi:hypothetical protein
MGMTIERAALALAVVLAGFTGPALHAQAAKNPLLQTLAQAEVDWETGSVTVHAGAAADLRLPGPDAARPAARRAAEKQAEARLAEALKLLPLGGSRHFSDRTIAAALPRARAKDIDYQSNGGVTLSYGIDFTDLVVEPEAAPPPSASADEARPPKQRRPGGAGKLTGQRVPDLERAPEPGGKSAAPGPVVSGEEVPEVLLSVASMPLEMAPRLLVSGVERTLGSAVYRMGEAPKARKAHPARRDKQGRLVFSLPAAESARLDGAHAIIYVRNVLRR